MASPESVGQEAYFQQTVRHPDLFPSDSDGTGTGVSPVCRLHDSHGRDSRATALEAPWPPQSRLTQHLPGV